MDIKELIDPEEGGRDRKPTYASPSRQPGVIQPRNNDKRDVYTLAEDTRSPAHSLHRSSYQTINTISPNGQIAGQYYREGVSPQFARSPTYPYQHGGNFPQDARLSTSTPTHPVLNPSTPVTATPTTSTPGSANGYSHWPRPDSSHSTSTPTFANVPLQNYARDSPQVLMSPNGAAVPLPSHRQQASPISGTPLGPPPAIHRASLESLQSPSSSAGHKRKLSTERLPSNVRQKTQDFAAVQSPHQSYQRVSSNERSHSERAHSLSVSPKTQASSVASAGRRESREQPFGSVDNHHSGQTPSATADSGAMMPKSARPSIRRASSMGINSMLNAAPSEDLKNQYAQQMQNADNTYASRESMTPKSGPSTQLIPEKSSSQVHPQALSQGESRISQDSTISKISPPLSRNQSHVTSFTSGSDTQQSISTPISETATSLKRSYDNSTASKADLHANSQGGGHSISPKMSSIADAPPRKKMRAEAEVAGKPAIESVKKRPPKPPRFREVPIWARSVRQQTKGRPSNFQNNNTRPSSLSTDAQVNCKTPIATQVNEVLGPLGKLEPSLINEIPSSDITEYVSNELYLKVLDTFKDVGVAPLDGPAGPHAVLEIEAKLGRIIDRNTMDRLQIPVETETMIRRGDPSLRLQFESSMTRKQHSTLNNFLNKALTATLQPSQPTNGAVQKVERVRMGYKHTKETDTFYHLPRHEQALLPAILRDAKVRVTRDLQGNEVAKILKSKQLDYDIYCPRFEIDYRISISVEKLFPGSTVDLVEMDSKTSSSAKRFKDRVSYSHQQCHFDLTQVQSPKEQNEPQVDHELEVEVSSQDVRQQAQLLAEGKPNQYADLIRNFVNNIRTLARAVPKDVPHMLFHR